MSTHNTMQFVIKIVGDHTFVEEACPLPQLRPHFLLGKKTEQIFSKWNISSEYCVVFFVCLYGICFNLLKRQIHFIYSLVPYSVNSFHSFNYYCGSCISCKRNLHFTYWSLLEEWTEGYVHHLKGMCWFLLCLFHAGWPDLKGKM